MTALHPAKANHAHTGTYHLRALGADGADLTLQSGTGYNIASIARQNEGIYKITFQHDPGKMLNKTYAFESVTMDDLKSYTLVFGVYDDANKALTFTVYSSGTPADLVANQYVNIDLSFSEHGV